MGNCYDKVHANWYIENIFQHLLDILKQAVQSSDREWL